ncbi:hypothetical protein N9B98_00365 [bacterium]|nr:hypothetical protein [bacterium]
MNPFKSAVVCVAVVAIWGCDQGKPTPPVASKTTQPVATRLPPRPPAELPESADTIGTNFRMIAAGTFTTGEGDDTHAVSLAKLFKSGVHEATQAQHEQVMDATPAPS